MYVDPLGLVAKFPNKREGQLRNNLNNVISKQMSFIKDTSTIFHNSTNDAIDIIVNYDNQITATANKYGLDKALIQSVLLREIRWADPTDDIADSLVIQTQAYSVQFDAYMNQPWYKHLLVRPPNLPVKLSNDSSTGVGTNICKNGNRRT